MSADQLAIALNTVWVLVTGFLVFFMQAGFAMVEAGFTRAKNAGNIVLKKLMDFAVASVAFWALGFAIMFGADRAGIIGTTGWFLNDTFEHLGLSIPLLAFWFFQVVFAGTAATIVSGAMAERTKFSTYLVFSALITILVYPVVGHWIWGGGWLSRLGFLDFAGSTVVHSVGGWASLAGLLLLGPRLGKYDRQGRLVRPVQGHSLTLAALGTFILWFGWFGFNPGSTLAGTDLNIARIAVTTNLAAAAGAIAALAITWIRTGKPDPGMAMNGALGGLVGITAGTAFVSPGSSLVIGLVAGILVPIFVGFFDRLRVDDAVGAVTVHGVCGAWGTLAVGLFHEELGLLFGGGVQQMLVQLAGVIATLAYVLVVSLAIFAALRAIMGLWVSREEEIKGLDAEEHGVVAYPEFVLSRAEPELVAGDD